MKKYILTVGFCLGLIWPYVEFAIITDQLLQWWEQRQKAALQEELKEIIAKDSGNVAVDNVIYNGDQMASCPVGATCTSAVGDKGSYSIHIYHDPRYIPGSKWVIYEDVVLGAKTLTRNFTVQELDPDSWPNKNDCPWDEKKQANICKP